MVRCGSSLFSRLRATNALHARIQRQRACMRASAFSSFERDTNEEAASDTRQRANPLSAPFASEGAGTFVRAVLPHVARENFRAATTAAEESDTSSSSQQLLSERNLLSRNGELLDGTDQEDTDLEPAESVPEGLLLEMSNAGELDKYLHVTTDPEAAWLVYNFLQKNNWRVRTHIIRKLVTLIGKAPPRRTHFLRLLSLVNAIRARDEFVYANEWNRVIAASSKGRRGHRVDNYDAALGLYNEMLEYFVSQRDKSAKLRSSSIAEGFRPAQTGPDLQTYHILLNIAVLTQSRNTVRHATVLLLESGIASTARTHAIMIPFYGNHGRLGAIRNTLQNILNEDPDNLDIGAVNSVIWAYAKSGELKLAMDIYRALQSHTTRHHGGMGTEQINSTGSFVESLNLTFPRTLRPDAITYSCLAQAFAYHGDLYGALRIFRDFLQSPVTPGASDDEDAVPNHPDDEPRLYASVMPIYRAVFLGFARHASTPVATLVAARSGSLSERLANLTEAPTPWTWQTFDQLFTTFLELDPRVDMPSERLVFWILVAVAKTTACDVRKMWSASQRIQKAFGEVKWRGRLQRMLDQIIAAGNTGYLTPFPEDIVKQGARRLPQLRYKG